MKQLIECVPNFSEGVDMILIKQITDEIESVAGVKLLDVDPGQATNRTVVTFVGSPDDVIEATLQREVWEELRIEVEVVRLLRVDAVPYVVEEPGPYRLDFYYLCLPVQGFKVLREELASGKVKPTSPEVKEMRLVALTDLAEYDLFSPGNRFLHDDLPRIEPALRDKSGN